jgi:hypothetical protein
VNAVANYILDTCPGIKVVDIEGCLITNALDY